MGRRFLFALAFAGAMSPSVAMTAESNVFVGTTPANETIHRLLGAGPLVVIDLVEWKITIDGARYRAQARYGRAVPNQRGLSKRDPTFERTGAVREGLVERGGGDVETYELQDLGSLERVSKDLLHFLAPSDRSLMIGDSGQSYSLSREGREEPADGQAQGAPPPDPSYTISPVAEGPTVYGVFEGRTPCRGVAEILGMAPRAGCFKAKWRVTLLQDPTTRHPTTYLAEGTLFRDAPRKGRWSIIGARVGPRGRPVIELDAADSRRIRLMRGDGNVLFFVDEKDRVLIGNQEHAYTLSRRAAAK